MSPVVGVCPAPAAEACPEVSGIPFSEDGQLRGGIVAIVIVFGMGSDVVDEEVGWMGCLVRETKRSEMAKSRKSENHTQPPLISLLQQHTALDSFGRTTGQFQSACVLAFVGYGNEVVGLAFMAIAQGFDIERGQAIRMCAFFTSILRSLFLFLLHLYP